MLGPIDDTLKQRLQAGDIGITTVLQTSGEVFEPGDMITLVVTDTAGFAVIGKRIPRKPTVTFKTIQPLELNEIHYVWFDVECPDWYYQGDSTVEVSDGLTLEPSPSGTYSSNVCVTPTKYGTHTITVSVPDGIGGVVEETLEVYVPWPQVIFSINTNTTPIVDKMAQFTVNIEAAEGDAITVKAETDSGFTDVEGRTVRFTPYQTGTAKLTITVAGNAGPVTREYYIEVLEALTPTFVLETDGPPVELGAETHIGITTNWNRPLGETWPTYTAQSSSSKIVEIVSADGYGIAVIPHAPGTVELTYIVEFGGERVNHLFEWTVPVSETKEP